MNEIKAYIRPALGHKVMEALKAAGAKGLSATHVKGFGLFEDPLTGVYDAEVVEKGSDMLKIELVCPLVDVDRFVNAITQSAHTGKSGDGTIYVSPVLRAIRITTGEEGSV